MLNTQLKSQVQISKKIMREGMFSFFFFNNMINDITSERIKIKKICRAKVAVGELHTRRRKGFIPYR